MSKGQRLEPLMSPLRAFSPSMRSQHTHLWHPCSPTTGSPATRSLDKFLHRPQLQQGHSSLSQGRLPTPSQQQLSRPPNSDTVSVCPTLGFERSCREPRRAKGHILTCPETRPVVWGNEPHENKETKGHSHINTHPGTPKRRH